MKVLRISTAHNHLNRRKTLLTLIIITIVTSLLGTTFPFNTNVDNKTVAADSVFYDFVTQASTASWGSGAGSLPFPGKDNDSRGFACYRNNWQLEDDSTWARVLETHPQWVNGGWIMGRYPELTIPSGAELKLTVGFFKGATGTDGVTFAVQFEEFLGLKVAPKTYSILSHQALYDGKLDSISKDLNNLAGKTGNFILRVNAGQSSGKDWAAWAEAKIEVAAPTALPDLIVEDVWQVNNTIRYKVRNDGQGSVVNPLGGTTPFCNALFIDGELVAKDCVNIHEMLPGQYIDNPFDYYWETTLTQHTIKVCADWDEDIAESNEHNNCKEEEVEPPVIPPVIPPVTPPLISPVCYISGEILGFDYSLDTLKIKVCPAESTEQCTPEAGVSYVDVVRLPGEPAPVLTYVPLGPVKYQATVSCNASYIIEPVYSPQAMECRWIGSWEPSKYFVNLSGSKPFSTVPRDFHFVPYDSEPPTMRIMVSNPRPRADEDVLITILGFDDKGISSIRQRTDITFLDGSRRTGPWVKYTDIVAGLEGSTGGIQFSIMDDGIIQATVVAKVCDAGGNECSSSLTLSFGTCDDGYQDCGETGVDCGGPCPSECINCLGDYELGNNPSAYLYSPEHWDIIQMWAETALNEYASNHSVNRFDLDTSDEYIDAIAWWVMKHMCYRGDGFNKRINHNLSLGYNPGDYDHRDFPQPAYYTLRYSGLWRSTISYTDAEGRLHVWDPPADSEMFFFGDCEDFGILTTALLRSLGVSHRCIFNVEEPTHSFNIVNYKSKYRALEYGTIGGDDLWPDNLWNDKIGAFASYYGADIDMVKPWEYTMNYPGCESPRVEITGGGFGAERVWLDWDGWGINKMAAAGDFDGDGMDDIAAIWYDPREEEFDSRIFSSSGVNFEEPSESLGEGALILSSYPIYPLVAEEPPGSGGDSVAVFWVRPEDEERGAVTLEQVIGRCLGGWGAIGIGRGIEAVRCGDVDGDGHSEPVVFDREGDEVNVTVGGRLWWTKKFPEDELVFLGDFDGDGRDDIAKFNRRGGDVRIARSEPRDKFCWAEYVWHDNFCLGEETPLVGDFNGDGRDDIVTFKQDTGQVFVALSTIFGFWGDGWLWKDNFCYEGDVPLVGDFNGDGRDDIASLHEDDGTVRISVALSNPSNISYVSADPECNLCEVPFFQDAYLPSKCP